MKLELRLTILTPGQGIIFRNLTPGQGIIFRNLTPGLGIIFKESHSGTGYHFRNLTPGQDIIFRNLTPGNGIIFRNLTPGLGSFSDFPAAPPRILAIQVPPPPDSTLRSLKKDIATFQWRKVFSNFPAS